MSLQTYAELSNACVYSAMAVLTLAMLAFSGELAFGNRGRVGRSAAAVGASPRVLVRTGAGVADASAAAPQDEPDPALLLGPAVRDEPAEGRLPNRFGAIGLSLTVLGGLFLLGGVVLRGLAAQRAPWGNMYEFSITTSLVVVAGYLLAVWRRPALRLLGVFVVVPVLLMLGMAVTLLYVDAGPLVPALESYWLVIHVAAAILSGAVFGLGGVITVLYLLQDRWERIGRRGLLARRLPPSDQLDRAAYRLFAFVFPVWTFAIVAGAIWAENAWGRYWGWDPKETWALVTWIVFAGYLHARATAGWKGRRAAVIALIGMATFVFNYFGVNIWFSGLHSYGGLPTE